VQQTRAPITSDTVFDIASLSKAFTATLALMLIEEGKLSLDDPLTKHLPEISGYKEVITLRHMMQHTSGLPSFEVEEERTNVQFTPEQVLAWHARQKRLRFAPGARYEYSNSGYVLLSIIIERVARKPFPEFLRERIFIPLGMTHSTLLVAASQIAGRATGYRQSNSGFLVVSDSDGLRVQGDGGIQSTANDLLRWTEAWRTGGLLKPASAQLAVAPAQLNDGKRTGYGLGWGVGRVEGGAMMSHGGASRGFKSYLAIFPAREGSLTVIVLANQRETDAADVAMRLARIFLGP
jgi:CubicO group peptidase (beta-lactamase class C family)